MDIRELLLGKKPMAALADVVLFCRKLSFLLGSGLTVGASLPIIRGQVERHGFKSALRRLHNFVVQGEGFSSALFGVGVFPPFLCGFVGIGEKTGRLSEAFGKLADFYEEHAKIKRETSQALIYPGVVATVMLVVIVLAVVLVLPGYEDIFISSQVPLPAATSTLISISQFVSGNLAFIVPVMLIAVSLCIISARSRQGRYLMSTILLKLPLYRKGINLRICEPLSLLLGSSVNISEAVPMCAGLINNLKVKEDFRNLEAEIKKGRPFWAALERLAYVDSLFLGLARVGEESGNLPQAMESCSRYLLEEYRLGMKKLGKMVEPMVTLALGAILALVMLAVVLPTFQLAQVM